MTRKKTTKKMAKREEKFGDVMREFQAKTLRSGSKKGPIVTSPKQAQAIAFSEARKVTKKKK